MTRIDQSNGATEGDVPGPQNNRVLDLSNIWLPDALSDGTITAPDRSGERSIGRQPFASGDCSLEDRERCLPILDRLGVLDSLTVRQSKMVFLAVLLRIVAYEDLRHLFFRQETEAQVRKAALALDRYGWLKRWSAPMPRLGRHGHVHPTAKALHVVLPRLLGSTASEPWHPLIRLMTPRKSRAPLQLGSERPKWYAHQRDVNQIVAAHLRASCVFWASSWDAPFPSSDRAGIEFPQPDYVLVIDTPRGPELVFGEHDRGTEPLERFRERKLRAYARLSARADALLGFSEFHVQVSVSPDAVGGAVQRLRELTDATRTFGLSSMVRFALAPSLIAGSSQATRARQALQAL